MLLKAFGIALYIGRDAGYNKEQVNKVAAGGFNDSNSRGLEVYGWGWMSVIELIK